MKKNHKIIQYSLFKGYILEQVKVNLSTRWSRNRNKIYFFLYSFLKMKSHLGREFVTVLLFNCLIRKCDIPPMSQMTFIWSHPDQLMVVHGHTWSAADLWSLCSNVIMPCMVYKWMWLSIYSIWLLKLNLRRQNWKESAKH